jgi:predicted transport protein
VDQRLFTAHRKHRITLLLALDFNEVVDPGEIAKDASQKKFFVNAKYEGGVYLSIGEADDIERAIPIIRQSHEFASA